MENLTCTNPWKITDGSSIKIVGSLTFSEVLDIEVSRIIFDGKLLLRKISQDAKESA